jgi:hypothetical protein
LDSIILNSLFTLLIFYFIAYFYSLHSFCVYLYSYIFSISNMPPTGSEQSGQVLHSRSREIVSDVYKYMKETGPAVTVRNIGAEVGETTNGCIGK